MKANSIPETGTGAAGLEENESVLISPVRTNRERLASLDVFRGFTMFWIVGGGMLMVGLDACGHNLIIDAIVRQLEHSQWTGLHFYDCIWPSFMLMVGVSIPLSLAKRSLTESYRQQLAHAVQRTIVLFLLGSVRESISLGSPYLVELSSALQPIAIASLVAFLGGKEIMAVSSLARGNHPGRQRTRTDIRARPRNPGRFIRLQSQPGAFR